MSYGACKEASAANWVSERIETCCLAVLQLGRLKARCRQSWFLPKVGKQNVCQDTLLTSGLLAISRCFGLMIHHPDLWCWYY